VSETARIIAYDLPGHGGSLAFPGGSARVAAGAILADLDLRGVEKAHLAGHSMGGAIAALMALAEPDRIASLTLLAPGGFGPEINGQILRRYAASVSGEEIRKCLVAMQGPASQVTANSVQELESMRKTPGQTARLIEIAAAITRDDRQGVIPRKDLAALKMPVRVLWGDRDPVLPFAQALELPEGFELHVAGGAGHLLIEESPRAVLAVFRQAGIAARTER
jgi:pyruvate dehydrogenase E2 component (dihydrolipoamide acetyltransferase)